MNELFQLSHKHFLWILKHFQLVEHLIKGTKSARDEVIMTITLPQLLMTHFLESDLITVVD